MEPFDAHQQGYADYMKPLMRVNSLHADCMNVVEVLQQYFMPRNS